MNLERRSEIYLQRDLARRLRMVLKLYPQLIPEVRDEAGRRIMAERLMTVEELVEQHMNKIIETEYPLVLELERKLAAVEREMIKKGRNAADFQNITQGLNENA